MKSRVEIRKGSVLLDAIYPLELFPWYLFVSRFRDSSHVYLKAS